MDARNISLQLLVILVVLKSLSTEALRWENCNGNTMKPWQPKWSDESRDDLLCSFAACPELGPGFKPDSENPDKCCTCNSCTTWEGDEKDLSIEYASVLGRSLVISEIAPNSSDVYRVKKQFSDMTEIPSNICNWDNETNLAEVYGDHFQNMNEFWDNIVELDFTGNKIRTLPDINCLVRLDKLILNMNNIERLSNTSFNYLTRLRVLYLQENGMKNLDPSVLTSPRLNIFFAFLDNNDLDKLDVSNILSMYPFCYINYEHNDITELVNEDDFKLDMNKTYGPGFVSYENNQIEAFPNFKDLLQLDSWQQMGKLFSFGFDYRGIPIICDCNLQPFLELAQTIIDVIWLDYMNVTCAGPDKFKGHPVHKVPTDELFCPIKHNKGCQSPGCTCVDRPKEDTLYIDCSHSNLDTLPHIPVSNHSRYVALNVSNNNIKEIANMSYLLKLKSLDISNNDLLEFNDTIAKQLENCTELNISDNPKISVLPKPFQYRDICYTLMKNLIIECNCDTTWLETWVASAKCETNTLFHCNIPDVGITLATNFHESDLECFMNAIFYIIGSVIAAVALTLVITSASTYWFRYELLITYLRLRRNKRNAVLPYKYDVFVSFNENERHVTKWIAEYLNPRLQDSGYSTFLALKDLDYGTERDSEIIAAIKKSHNFLIVLSESYLDKADEGMRSWTENEWKYGWNNFRQDRAKNIVLVNYDHMEASAVDHPVIKAYLRVGCTVDFENHNRNIMDDIETKLGKPITCQDIDTKVNDNMIKKFTPVNLFITSPYHDEDSDIELDLERFVNVNDHTLEIGNSKFQNKRKLCKYRQCYACKQKALLQQENVELAKVK